jgi:hypothetical protein
VSEPSTAWLLLAAANVVGMSRRLTCCGNDTPRPVRQ